MFIDCHSHILPNVDDGPNSMEMSLKMVEMSIKQGVGQIWLTPHFNAGIEDYRQFIIRRNDSFSDFVKESFMKENMDYTLGSEVLLNYTLLELGDISELCLNHSRYILTEYDENYSVDDFVKMLNILINKFGVTPIVAHIDRYKELFSDNAAIENLREIGCLIQMNNEALLRSLKKVMAANKIKRGYIDILGSDCHNITSRAPNFEAAAKAARNLIGEKFINEINENAVRLCKKMYA